MRVKHEPQSGRPQQGPDVHTEDASVRIARQVIREQAEALVALAGAIGPSFADAVRLILHSSEQMVVSGVGKSGLIARKAAATLASTGTRAMFMHPVEGVHGDLGAVSADSILLALSKSGNTDELVRFVGFFKRLGGRVIALCEDGGSALGEAADIVLLLPKLPEAGPLALAPTTSTLMMLSLCDALAMALLEARGFDEGQFARYHPDGSLGRRLLTRVRDLMHGGAELPAVRDSAGVQDLLLEMTGKHLGMTCILDAGGLLTGVFTDGDLRRLLMRSGGDLKMTAGEAWRRSRRDPSEPPVRCSTVQPDLLAVDCLRTMRDSEITVLVVSEDGERPVGVVRLQDLVRAGLG